ncbi:outer membrane protein TolC [Mucilaginibacter yixingensis]|uniref:Outer membrane protein TolC n=1 Tax=Mucilaginibacter yixingensis TaxID=1295612 RepID=A0A2T5JBM7_9SPHI|nr:TolC family protein [Mucilaginibacter yixingensis]PTQ98268.1 outer membrane protein TolC [Mucilaginibacter yixingensis]
MKKRCIYTVTAALLLIFYKPASAQNTGGQLQHLSLDEVWAKAVTYNKQLHVKKQEVESGKEEIKDAMAERLPEVQVGGDYARVSNMPIFENGLLHTPSQYPVLHSTYGLDGDAYLNIYNGNKTNLHIAQKQTLEAEKQIQVAQTQSQVKLLAAVHYLELQKGLMFKQLLLSDIAAQQKQLDKIEQLRKNGVVLKSDVLRAQLQLSRQQLSVTTIDNDIAIARQQLAVTMSEPDDFAVQPDSTSLADSAGVKTYNELLADAYHHAFAGKISEQETQLKALQLKDVKGSNMPKVGLFATYSVSYPQIMFYPYSPYLYGFGLAGVKASFSISGLYTNRHKIKAAQIELQKQETEHEDMLDGIRLSVNNAYLRLQEARHRVEVAKVNVKQAEENSRIVNNTYFNQTSLITDLLDANNTLLQTRFELTAAQIGEQVQYYQLQNAIGDL